MGAPVDGYPSLASFMASDPDQTATIFKRFNRLSARNLLYLQSELTDLDAQLNVLDEQDRGMPCARSWDSFKKRGQDEPERMVLIKKIRETMLEYKTLLAHEATLMSLNAPDRRTLKAFRYNYHHGDPRDARSYPILAGTSMKLYDDASDLLVLRSASQPDRLSMFVQDHLAFFFQDGNTREGASTVARVDYASGDRINAFVSFLSTILAALLLIGAIVILYKVPSPDVKLGLIGVFTIMFAASVGLLTNARRAEIFGATAAYAAVLVVFVSGDFGVTK